MISKDINVKDLTVAKTNVRKRELVGIDELAANIKEFGLIHPLVVRKSKSKYEIIAGQRRFTAIEKLNLKNQVIKTVSCQVISGSAENDEAISLSENSFTQMMDDVERCSVFSQFVKSGTSINKIAKQFGMSSHSVNQYISIGNLTDKFKELYYSGDMSGDVLKYCTRFSTKEQNRILKAIKNKDINTQKWSIKEFMFKSIINPKYALFDLDKSGVAISNELFSEDVYVADIDEFWKLQQAEVDKLKTKHEKNGWKVKCVGPDEIFYQYSYEKGKKEEGAYVVLQLNSNGKFKCHKGLVLNSTENDDSSDSSIAAAKPKRQEISADSQKYYTNWHYHMVRNHLQNNPEDCFKWFVTNLLCGNGIYFDNNNYASEEIDSQLKKAKVRTEVNNAIKKISKKYDFDDTWKCPIKVYKKVSKLSPADLMEICNVALLTSLSSNSKTIEFIGTHNKINPLDHWVADEDTISSLSSKDSTAAVANELIKDKDKLSTFEAKTIKQIKSMLSENLDPEYVPAYMMFPITRYGETPLNIEQDIK